MKDIVHDGMQKYIENELSDYYVSDDQDPKTFFKMAQLFEMHRIADALEELAYTGIVTHHP